MDLSDTLGEGVGAGLDLLVVVKSVEVVRLVVLAGVSAMEGGPVVGEPLVLLVGAGVEQSSVIVGRLPTLDEDYIFEKN